MKLTDLGFKVFWICLAIVSIELLVALFWIVDHVNWVGDHWCLHSMTKCYFGGK